jgi:hypothetical protein
VEDGRDLGRGVAQAEAADQQRAVLGDAAAQRVAVLGRPAPGAGRPAAQQRRLAGPQVCTSGIEARFVMDI